MKRTILTFGLILGAILSINMVYMVHLCYTNDNFESSEILGYTTMIIVFSLIFFGVRNYRNKKNEGVVTFGNAFKIGALIALIGSTLYVAIWLVEYYLFVPDFMDKYTTHVMREATNSGATAPELADKVTEMEQFKEWYKSPILVILLTFTEVLPMGLIVALVSALILKKKKISN
jgi:hypothetical protein